MAMVGGIKDDCNCDDYSYCYDCPRLLKDLTTLADAIKEIAVSKAVVLDDKVIDLVIKYKS